jgi:spore coat protein A
MNPTHALFARPRPRRGPYLFAIALSVVLVLVPLVAHATVVTIAASKDNTLYENATGSVSNGVGEYLFTGRTKDGVKHRAVIAFNVGAFIPAGSTINSVTLQLHLSREANTTLRVTSLYRLLADWGEGTSNAGQNEGQGAPATTGDATWLHRFYPSTLWTTVGGDFSATASASTGVTSNGTYTWSSAAMAVDAQGWLNNAATNFGWLIEGDEATTETSKRFDSRENGQTASRPALVVDYTSGGGATGACCYGDTCDVLTSAACVSLGGTYHGDGTTCTPDPCPPPGTTVTITATSDNTLYQDATGSVSNGAGTKMIVSKNASAQVCRGVLRFDLASAIPSGAVISAASLTLYNAEAATSAADVTVYRASAGWGEGTSVAPGTETVGAPSTTGDATWIHRLYPGTLWTTAGGDFSATSSALTNVTGAGFYSWTSAALLAEVQGWVDQPSTNFGWILRGKETGASGSAVKRFESRQSVDVAHRPQLQITYVAPPTGACCLPDGSCDTLSAAACAAAGGTYQGDGTDCGGVFCPLVLQAFVDSLPIPAVATPVSGTVGGVAKYVIPITEQPQKYHRDLPPARVWGYAGTYPGPTIVASYGKEVTVQWVNDLRDSTGALRTSHYLPVDLCVHGPDMEGPTARVVAHLHGGHVESSSDGYPTSTILPGQSQTFHYPNKQLPATLWYHDHALGITRLNVMMGLAGFYLLVDSVETALGLPSGPYEIGLAVQDRTLRADGSIVYPAAWQEHFFGDKAVVNGKVWPYLNVKQGKYRFRMLDGSTSRSYTFHLSNGAPLTIIGTEGGMLPAPVTVDSLTMTPGERYDVILDFAPYAAGTEIVLTNTAPAPFPNGMAGEEPAIPQIMKFIVQGQAGHTAPIPASLRPIERLQEGHASVTRSLVLAKTSGGACGSEWTINGLGFDDVTEFPVLDSTEIWQFVNRSGVTHPMHMHLTMFQILDRQAFTASNDSILPVGPRFPPNPQEAGWKDTAPVPPNTIVRVITRFEDYVGRYPYHCHILEHEENEMMRQFQVVHSAVTAVEAQTPRYRLALERCRPNPFNPETRIDYQLPKAARVHLEVFDVSGRLVTTLVSGQRLAGQGSVVWNGCDSRGQGVASGVYAYRLTLEGGRSLTRKMVLLK